MQQEERQICVEGCSYQIRGHIILSRLYSPCISIFIHLYLYKAKCYTHAFLQDYSYTFISIEYSDRLIFNQT